MIKSSEEFVIDSVLRCGWCFYVSGLVGIVHTLDLNSSRIQMVALGHTSTPFCFVVRQFLGFYPGQVHLSEVSFDDIYPVLGRPGFLL